MLGFTDYFAVLCRFQWGVIHFWVCPFLLAWLWGVSLFTIAGPSEIGVCVLLIQIAFKLGVSDCPQIRVCLPYQMLVGFTGVRHG